MKQRREYIKQKLVTRLTQAFSSKSLGVEKKADHSPVTEIDLYVSDLVKSELKKVEALQNYHFYSEEDQESFEFPCAVLDPIDGTRELVAGLPECSLSLGLMASARLDDPASDAWLYNPFTGLDLSFEAPFLEAPNIREGRLAGMVSNTEFRKGYFKNHERELIQLTPKGSIAYKLGLLAIGACDFVVSANPKNIWDIAGGSLLLERRGIHLYQNGERLKELSQKSYAGGLLWCREEHKDQILKALEPCLKRDK